MSVNEIISYVHGFIEARDSIATKLPVRYPFRRLAGHCYRTYRWAQRIQECEGGDLEIVEIAALFHDIGKCLDCTSDGHARAGAEVCGQYLMSQGYDDEKTSRIVYVVRNHVHSVGGVPLSLEAHIVRDADLLDEVGALTVLWDAMAAGAERLQSYTIAYERIRMAYSRLRARGLGSLETETGRQFYKERIDFLDQFLSELEYELGKTKVRL